MKSWKDIPKKKNWFVTLFRNFNDALLFCYAL
jgi:hypothetical protein